MPLDRQHITRASMLMLPVDVLFSVALGLVWALQDPSRTSPALQAIRDNYSPRAVGWCLVTIGLIILVGMVTNHRGLCAVGLAAGAATYLILAVIFVAGILHPHLSDAWPFIVTGRSHATLSGSLWPLYLVAAHLASLISLAFDEGNAP